ncbi:MAG: DNA repair protein RecN [Cyclobacteriaceae bacterium]
MLRHLTIRNYALIRHLEYSPDQGFSVITGETGAGKSIMLGALGLLLGNRADSKVLLDATEKCVTEGDFHISDYGLEQVFSRLELDYVPETILRREISPGGKSRAFINDTPVTLEVMRTIGYRLMDIHSQHETLELGEQNFQLRLTDACAGNEQLLKKYRELWLLFRTAKENLEKLKSESERLNQEADYIRFQFQELDKASLAEDELEILEAKVKVGENAEHIRTKLQAIAALMGEGEYSALQIISQVRSLLSGIAGFDKGYADLLHRIESMKAEAEDIYSEIERESEKMEVDPAALMASRERLDLINTLLRKHRARSIKELNALYEKLSGQVLRTDHLESEIKAAENELEKCTAELQQQAVKLSDSRKHVFPKIAEQAESLLKELGIPDARFEIQHSKVPAGPYGMDSIEMCFSANKGVSLRPIAETASGGEFSRLMFVVKYIMAEKTSMPTLILDEIDSGISGDVALKLGMLMKRMAGKHQVIAISHLAQIAAKASSHFMVFKETDGTRAASQIKLLDNKKRVEELARIISGNSPSPNALKYARELME